MTNPVSSLMALTVKIVQDEKLTVPAYDEEGKEYLHALFTAKDTVEEHTQTFKALMAEFSAYSKELTPMLEILLMDDDEKEKWQSEVASRVSAGKDLRDRCEQLAPTLTEWLRWLESVREDHLYVNIYTRYYTMYKWLPQIHQSITDTIEALERSGHVHIGAAAGPAPEEP